MRNKISKVALFGYISMHLFLVTLSAFYIRIPEWMPGKDIFDFYQKASGADSSYGFFAPSIGTKTRALFDIIDAHGSKKVNISLLPEAGREVQTRLGGIYDEFSTKAADEAGFRRPLAASLAAAVFSQHADTAQVVLHAQEYRPKTMAEYRQGQRAGWSEYYVARFAYTSDLDKEMQK